MPVLQSRWRSRGWNGAWGTRAQCSDFKHCTSETESRCHYTGFKICCKHKERGSEDQGCRVAQVSKAWRARLFSRAWWWISSSALQYEVSESDTAATVNGQFLKFHCYLQELKVVFLIQIIGVHTYNMCALFVEKLSGFLLAWTFFEVVQLFAYTLLLVLWSLIPQQLT